MSNQEEKFTFEMLMQAFKKSSEEADKRSAEAEKRYAEFDAYLKKSRESFEADLKRSSEEAEKRSIESDKRSAELDKKIDKLVESLSNVRKEVGGIGEANGDMTEEIFFNALEKDMMIANIKFDYIQKNVPIQSEYAKTLTELDIMMVNGDTISIIEAKHKVERKDVNNLLYTKLKYFRQYYPKYNDYQILLGVCGMSFEEKAVERAMEQGLVVLKFVGDKFEYQTKGIKMY